MRTTNRLSWIAVALCSAAAIIQPWLDVNFMFVIFLALIVVADILVLIGVLLAGRQWTDFQEAVMLQDKWRQQRDRTR